MKIITTLDEQEVEVERFLDALFDDPELESVVLHGIYTKLTSRPTFRITIAKVPVEMPEAQA